MIVMGKITRPKTLWLVAAGIVALVLIAVVLGGCGTLLQAIRSAA